MIKKFILSSIAISYTLFAANLNLAFAATDVTIKERKQFGKVIRTRMPPQIMIERIQQEFQSMSPYWKTFWNNFVVEDDDLKDEYVIIARSHEKEWSFRVLKEDCPKPENYDQLKSETEGAGSPVRMDALIGIKRTKSFFRYVITIYEPIYPYWTNSCFAWYLPPGTAKDPFYKTNYNMKVYSENMSKKIYDLVSRYGGWKSPKNLMKLPAMKGPGEELIGGGSETLTDAERALPLKEREKLSKKRMKEIEKEDKKLKKEAEKKK